MADSGGGEDHNKKAPGLAAEDNPPTTHHNYHVTAGVSGKLSIRYDDIEDPQRSFQFDLDDNGSYTGSQAKGKGLVTTVTAGHKRDYTSKGSGTHADGNSESSTNGNQSTLAKKDIGEQSGGSKLEGNQKKVGGSKEGDVSITHDNKAEIIKGDNVLSVEGSLYTDCGGDDVKTVAGLFYQTIEGDHGVICQGNYDVKTEGKFQANSSRDMILSSATKLTLSVGGSSIVIEPSKITIKSASIEFIQ
jgi:hypothetical protein